MESGQEARFSDGRRERENNRQHELDAEIDRQKDNEGVTAPHDKMIDKNIHERNWKSIKSGGTKRDGEGTKRKDAQRHLLSWEGSGSSRREQVVDGSRRSTSSWFHAHGEWELETKREREYV